MNNSLFCCFEGIDGSGKTTQVAKAFEHYFAKGSLEVVVTKEPGGTPLAEHIRNIILFHEDEELSTKCETMLFYASRELHLNGVIRSSLKRGALVLCDRFADSTEAYQMAGGKLDQEFVSGLRKHIVGNTEPDLTFVFVMDVEKAFDRARERGALNRMEGKGAAYYVAAQEHFVKLAHQSTAKTEYVIIDAGQSIDAIHATIVREIDVALKRKQPQLDLEPVNV